MEERRRAEDKNWEEMKGSIKEFLKDFNDFKNESRDYRIRDQVNQEYIKAQVTKTNGRVDRAEEDIFDLKSFRNNIDTKIKDRKESKVNMQGYITLIATCVMAISALIVIFKNK